MASTKAKNRSNRSCNSSGVAIGCLDSVLTERRCHSREESHWLVRWQGLERRFARDSSLIDLHPINFISALDFGTQQAECTLNAGLASSSQRKQIETSQPDGFGAKR